MIFHPYLSNLVKQDIYVMRNGAIYLRHAGCQYHVGNVGTTSMLELHDNVEQYV